MKNTLHELIGLAGILRGFPIVTTSNIVGDCRIDADGTKRASLRSFPHKWQVKHEIENRLRAILDTRLRVDRSKMIVQMIPKLDAIKMVD
jgi:hypothetical protein